MADAEVMIAHGRHRTGERVRALKQSIDRPLAAILTLNTIAHTVGAAGVGAQSIAVFGEAWIGVTSAVLTLLVLVLSEIVPKTLGATHAKSMATMTSLTIQAMIVLTLPVVFLLDLLSKLMKGSSHHTGPSRKQIAVMAEMARRGGVLDAAESTVVENMLALKDITVSEVMTPRTVVHMLDVAKCATDVINPSEPLPFSRLPAFGSGPDDVRGIVLRSELLGAIAAGRGSATIESFLRPVHTIPAATSLFHAMERFRETGDHMFLVVDEFGGTAGVLTLEDLLESILGTEIVDETDPVADMRTLARERSGDGDSAGATASAPDAARPAERPTESPDDEASPT